MNNPLKIMDVALPIEVAADLTIRSAKAGMETSMYLGTIVLAGAYGVLHPQVIEFRRRAKLGVSGPVTQGDENGG